VYNITENTAKSCDSAMTKVKEDGVGYMDKDSKNVICDTEIG
jgi:hypothetical protein